MLSAECLKIVNSSANILSIRISLLRNWYVEPITSLLGRRYGLTEPEVSVLGWVGDHGGICAQDIVAITSRPKNTVSRAINLLLVKGFLTRRHDESDHRQKILFLTQAGRVLMDAVEPIWARRESRLRALYSKQELLVLERLLGKAVTSLPANEEPAPVELKQRSDHHASGAAGRARRRTLAKAKQAGARRRGVGKSRSGSV